MCVLSKYFKTRPDLDTMTESQINKYIEKLDKVINEEKIASKIANQSDEAKEELYKKIEKREEARLVLQKKFNDKKQQ